MLHLPSAARPLLMSLSVAFTQPTFQRILPLCAGTILTAGRRTVTGFPWTIRGLVRGHPSTAARRSTTRAVAMTPSAPATPTWSDDEGTAGSCRPSRPSSPSPRAAGSADPGGFAPAQGTRRGRRPTPQDGARTGPVPLPAPATGTRRAKDWSRLVGALSMTVRVRTGTNTHTRPTRRRHRTEGIKRTAHAFDEVPARRRASRGPFPAETRRSTESDPPRRGILRPAVTHDGISFVIGTKRVREAGVDLREVIA